MGKSGTGAAKGGEAEGHATVAGGGRGGVWHIAHTSHDQMAIITQNRQPIAASTAIGKNSGSPLFSTQAAIPNIYAGMREVATPTTLHDHSPRLLNLMPARRAGLTGACAGAGRPGFCQNGTASTEQQVCTAGLPAPEGEVQRVAGIRPDHYGMHRAVPIDWASSCCWRRRRRRRGGGSGTPSVAVTRCVIPALPTQIFGSPERGNLAARGPRWGGATTRCGKPARPRQLAISDTMSFTELASSGIRLRCLELRRWRPCWLCCAKGASAAGEQVGVPCAPATTTSHSIPGQAATSSSITLCLGLGAFAGPDAKRISWPQKCACAAAAVARRSPWAGPCAHTWRCMQKKRLAKKRSF